jgi:hypothetical protein
MIREIKFRFILSFVLFFILAINLTAQREESVESDSIAKVKLVELSFDVVQPLADFQRKLDGNPVGFSTRYFWQAKVNKPVFLGFGFNYSHLFSISEDYIDFIDGFQVDLRQSVKSHLLGLHFIFRYYPALDIPLIQPYLEGFAGSKIAFATDVVRDIETGESLQFDFRDGGMALSYGMATGFQIDVKDGVWYILGRFSYELGTSSSFLGLNPVDSQRLFDLETRNAALQMMRYQIGFTFAF